MPKRDLKNCTLTALKEQKVDISKIELDEHWWAKNPSDPKGQAIEGPPKNGAEFLPAHPLKLAEDEVSSLTPAQDFWSVAGDWMKRFAIAFPNQKEFRDALFKEKVWPDSFFKTTS